jgi:beta-mannosidase
VKEQIEYLRQRKYRPIASMYHYYWSDPCPIMGSGLLDYYRRPYQVYDAMKNVYTRVLVSLERDVKPYIIGREKVYDRGTAFTGTVWVTNDFPHPIDEVRLSWRIEHVDTGDVVLGNGLTAALPEDSVLQGDRIRWTIPTSARSGAYRVAMEVHDANGQALSTNSAEITVR